MVNPGKQILITGASGFIGRFLVEEALTRGYQVFVTIRPSTDIRRLSSLPARMVMTDFSNSRDLESVIGGLPRFDCVIHNAGATKVLRSGDFFQVNLGHTQRLIHALKLQNKIPGRFLYMSSLASYGPGENQPGSLISEETEPQPVTSYGRSKLAAELFITGAGIPYVIFRPTAVYGPGDQDFLRTIRLIARGIDFQVGKGPRIQTFIYVKDLARLVFDAAESPVSNRAYFVSDGRLYNAYDLGLCVSHHLGVRARHVAVPAVLAKGVAALAAFFSLLSRKPAVLYPEKINELSASNWNCDTRPLVSDFGFRARYDLDAGMKETIEWYKNSGWL